MRVVAVLGGLSLAVTASLVVLNPRLLVAVEVGIGLGLAARGLWARMEAMDDEPRADPVSEQVLDGNALAGMLAAAFGGEMTAVPGRCAHCGTMTVIAGLRAYVRAPGAVLRCPVCNGIVLRMVETPEATYVDVRGAAYLRFERR